MPRRALSFPFPKKHAVAGMRRRKDSFPPQPLPIFVHPLPTCPQFLAYPRRAPPSLARSISTPKGRETAATQAKKATAFLYQNVKHLGFCLKCCYSRDHD